MVTFYGPYKLNGKGLEQLCKMLRDTMGSFGNVNMGQVADQKINIMSPGENDVQWSYRSFAEAVAGYSECLCRDPMDRVYGLLALPYRTQRPPPIQVDYRKTLEQVFEEAVTYMIEEVTPYLPQWQLYRLFANAGRSILPGTYLDVLRKIPEARDIVIAIEDSEVQGSMGSQ